MIFRRLENGVIIREASLDDAEDLVGFYKKVTSETEFLITEPDEVHDLSHEKYLIRIYTSEWNRLYLVAVSSGKVVGSLKFAGNRRKRVSRSGELSIAVLKDYWGMGIGSALMEELIGWAEKAGIIRLELDVLDINQRAIRLYEKFDFHVECVKKKAARCSKGWCDLLHMVRFLG